MMQALMAGLIVAAAAAYTVWSLMPAAWRAALLQRLTGKPPAPRSGCGACGDCSGPPGRKGGAAQAQPIRIQRRIAPAAHNASR